MVTPEPNTSPEPRPGRVASAVAAARARFRRVVPSGWNWRRFAVGVALAETAVVLFLVVYLAATGRSLVVELRDPPPPEVPTEPPGDLVIPVAGVLPGDLEDTWGAPRTPTRNHRGIDIRAPRGTPVLASAPGVVVQMARNSAGGVTLHVRGLDGRTVYYYAHLERYRTRLKVGDLVRQGDTIGYVGDSGNAAGIPHLHFAVYSVVDPNRVSDGRHFNPYPLLVDTLPAPGSPDGR